MRSFNYYFLYEVPLVDMPTVIIYSKALSHELSNVNSLWRLEYDSPSSPMAVALFIAVVSLLSAKRVATQFSFERYDCCLLKVGR